MRTRHYRAGALFFGCLLGLATLFSAGCGHAEHHETGRSEDTWEGHVFAKDVQDVLDARIALLEELARVSVVRHAVKQSNRENRVMTSVDILKIDARWQTTPGQNAFIRSFLTNECARRLVDFQNAHHGFPEVFVTDEKGLIVAESNRTSDYYQGDEDWWTKAYDGGRGRSFHGEIEYDASAGVEAISLYVPVRDSGAEDTIGVMKAVCEIDAITRDL